MRVLMYGWEFPPHITGGLGTACHGLSNALAPLVDKITFVLPRIKGTPPPGAIDLMSVRDIPVLEPMVEPVTATATDTGVMNSGHAVRTSTPSAGPRPSDWQQHIETLTIPSPLRPYVNATTYAFATSGMTHGHARTDAHHPTCKPQKLQTSPHRLPSLVELSGDYGHSLYEEVARYAQVAAQIVETRPFDVIHAHDWMTFLAGVEAKRRSRLPLVVHVHALEFDRSGENIDQRVYEIERFGMMAADHVIAVSQRTKDTIVARYGIAADKVEVVYNGIEGPAHLASETFQARREEHRERPQSVKRLGGKVIVFLGRITMQKGPEYFLEAAYLVSKKLPDARFVMAGSGDMLPRVIERMAELRLLDRFHFTGFVNARQRNQLLEQADLFVMPSVSEPFGITPVEAIQHGVPVVITKQSGVAEILRHAIKVDFWDVRRIADAMIKVLTTDGLSRQLIDGSKDDLAAISWEKSASKILHLYQRLICYQQRGVDLAQRPLSSHGQCSQQRWEIA